jgi:hypothetical protein
MTVKAKADLRLTLWFIPSVERTARASVPMTDRLLVTLGGKPELFTQVARK